jgi:hypothetical protein
MKAEDRGQRTEELLQALFLMPRDLLAAILPPGGSWFQSREASRFSSAGENA